MPKLLVDAAQEIIRTLGTITPDNECFVWVDETHDRIIIECGYVSVGISRKSIEDNIHTELAKEVIPAALEAVKRVRTAAFGGKMGLGNE